MEEDFNNYKKNRLDVFIDTMLLMTLFLKTMNGVVLSLIHYINNSPMLLKLITVP